MIHESEIAINPHETSEIPGDRGAVSVIHRRTANEAAIPRIPLAIRERMEPFYFSACGELHNASLPRDKLLLDSKQEVFVVGQRHGAVEITSNFQLGAGPAEKTHSASVNPPHSGSHKSGASDHGGR